MRALAGLHMSVFQSNFILARQILLRKPALGLAAGVSAHFMKNLLTIILLLISSDSFCQIESQKEWPASIQREFDLIKEQKNDTFLIYYSYLGPWTDLPDSCKNIPSVWILWIQNNDCYARQLICDSVTNAVLPISSVPFKYFITHIEDFRLKQSYLDEHIDLPPIQSDESCEYLIFMTLENNILLNLSESQRTDDIWKQFTWIKPTIEVFDLTLNEIINK